MRQKEKTMNILDMLGLSSEGTEKKNIKEKRRKKQTQNAKATSNSPSLFDFFDFDIFNLKEATVIDEKQVYVPQEKKKFNLPR